MQLSNSRRDYIRLRFGVDRKAPRKAGSENWARRPAAGIGVGPWLLTES